MGDKFMVTTRAQLGVCPRCRALMITGHSEGLPARVEPWPVNLAAEVAAILGGRLTYSWCHDRRLVQRPPALARRVLVGHRCGSPLSSPPVITPHHVNDDVPPY